MSSEFVLKDANVLRFDLAIRYLSFLDTNVENQKYLETTYARPRVWRTPNVVRLICHYKSDTIETIGLLKNLHAIRVMLVCAFSSIVGFYQNAPDAQFVDRFYTIDTDVMNARTRMYHGPEALPFVDFKNVPTEEHLEEVTQKALTALIAISIQKRPYYEQFPIDPVDESKGEIAGPHDRVRWFLESEIACLRFECDRYKTVFREFSDDDYVNWEIRCLEWFAKKTFYLMRLISLRRAGATLPPHETIVRMMVAPTPWYDKNDGFMTGYQTPTDRFHDDRDVELKKLQKQFDDLQKEIDMKYRLKRNPEPKPDSKKRPAKRSHELV